MYYRRVFQLHPEDYNDMCKEGAVGVAESNGVVVEPSLLCDPPIKPGWFSRVFLRKQKQCHVRVLIRVYEDNKVTVETDISQTVTKN